MIYRCYVCEKHKFKRKTDYALILQGRDYTINKRLCGKCAKLLSKTIDIFEQEMAVQSDED